MAELQIAPLPLRAARRSTGQGRFANPFHAVNMPYSYRIDESDFGVPVTPDPADPLSGTVARAIR